MRVMVDTNVLVSALLFPASLPADVLRHIDGNHELVLCEYIIGELRQVVVRKRPDLLAAVEELLAGLTFELAAVALERDRRVSDPKDQPILHAAVLAGVDIIVSGDKHFLQLDLERPKIMTPKQFRERGTSGIVPE
jgi:putative PIN family toxin of toxin-antitoxin system